MSKTTTLRGSITLKEFSPSSGEANPILTYNASTGEVTTKAAVDTSTFISATLASGSILVGSNLNVATAVAVSGDITISNTGVAAIAAGVITNSDVNSSAGIVYSKLNLTGSLLNADVNASAGIVYSKLNLTGSLLNADINAAAGITRSKTAVGTAYRILANTSGGVMSENAALTASKAIGSDTNGQLQSLTTTTTQINYLSNLTGDVQAQLDDEIATKAVEAIVKAPTVTEHGYAITWNNTNGKWDLTDPVTQGIPIGGTTRQALLKTNGSDWITDWYTLLLSDISDVSASVADVNVLLGADAAGITPTVLSYIATLTSDAQTQIGNKLTNSLAQNAIWLGNASNQAGVLAAGTNGHVLTISAGVPTWQAIVGTGTVTSVDVSGGATGLTFSGGPIATTGTITMAGTLDANNGGTGITSFAVGDILYANTTSTLTKLVVGADGTVLTLAGGLPAWAIVSGVSGLTTNRIPYATSPTLLGDDSGFTWDATNNALTVGDIRIFSDNTSSLFIGTGAGNFTTSGVANTIIGNVAGDALTSGARNTAVGSGAGGAITTGTDNTTLGHNSGTAITTTVGNVMVGATAGLSTTGSTNTFIGTGAQASASSGSSNVVIGYDINTQSLSGSNQLSIQNAILGAGNSGSNQAISTGIISHYSAAAIGSWSKATFLNNMAAEGTAIANGIVVYGKDSSDGSANSTLALYLEQAPEATATFTQTHRLKIWINGVEFYLALDAV